MTNNGWKVAGRVPVEGDQQDAKSEAWRRASALLRSRQAADVAVAPAWSTKGTVVAYVINYVGRK